MKLGEHKIAYVLADLKRIGPTNQTLNIIRYSGSIENCVVIKLFPETEDTQIDEYLTRGVRVICLDLSRKTVLFKGVSALKKALKREGVSLVHSWGTFADIIAHYACKSLGLKHMITLRNFPVEEMTTRMNYHVGMAVARFDLHILKNCKHVVCCSRSIRRKMEDAYHWTHLNSIQNGVDFNKFKPHDRAAVRAGFGLTDEDFVYIATGSMIPRKHIDETADAFVQAGLPENCRLWFLGDGNLLEEMKAKYAANKNIVFWGKQADVARFLSAADVFVSSSESEGMPNAVLEAIACKLPVYLSDIPQHMEVFESLEGCGKAYPLGNRAALAELMASGVKDEIAAMRAATEQLYASSFTMENMGKHYRDYYLQVLEADE